MKSLRIFGVIVLLAGVVMIGASQYIKGQVLEGRAEISSGEQKVSTGRKAFGVNPVTKEVGDAAFFNSADQKIAAGKAEADHYENLANQLQTGGIISIVVGAGLILWSFKKKR